MALGKGIHNENELFAAAGKMSACLQAHFVPHMDTWRADARRPRAAMVMVPKRNDMVSKAIQILTPIEPEAPKPQRISLAIPQPQSKSFHSINVGRLMTLAICPTPKKPDVAEYPLGIPPGRDVVEKQINTQKHLHSAKVTINNQAEKVKVQAEELKRKDGVITRLQARINQLEEENSILELKAKPHETPLRRPSVGILSRGIEVQKKEIEYQKRQLEIKQAHNIRLRDLLQSNGISSGLEDDIHEERRGMEDGRRSNQGLDDERGANHRVDEERRSDRGIDDGRRSNHGIDDKRRSDYWSELEIDDGRARIMDEEKGGFRDGAGVEIDHHRDRDREDNGGYQTTPTKRPSTPTKVLSIKGHAQSPQAPMSNTRRAGGGLDKMAALMADFTELVAGKASRRVSATGSISNEVLPTSGRSYPHPREPVLSGSGNPNPTLSDIRINSPARSDQTDPREVDKRRRSATVSSYVGSRSERAAELDQDSRSPWERSRVEGKKIIPTGPRSDRPQTPLIGPVPPPIGPRLPEKTGRKRHGGIGAYYSKDKASRKMWDRYNRLE
jgi:hypothetical protein